MVCSSMLMRGTIGRNRLGPSRLAVRPTCYHTKMERLPSRGRRRGPAGHRPAFSQGLPCEVERADDGAQALELFRANAYVLVLLDLEMPG